MIEFEQLDEGDIPKTVLTKIPEGFAVVNLVDAREKLNSAYEQMEGATEEAHQLVSRAATRFGFGGLIVGAGLGAVGAYFVTKKQLETKYSEIAASEIAEMREHYQAKIVALDGQQTKPELESLVRDAGYSSELQTEPPMAVTPPNSVVEAAQEEVDTPQKRQEVIDDLDDSDTADAQEDQEREQTERVFDKSEPQPIDGWDYVTERSRRSPLRPYVIHIDEKGQTEDRYDDLTFTYYEADDVLCNEADEVISGPERENLVGEGNLNRFGHGSGDSNIVYIRNDRMETVIELVRSPNAYAEEVHGFQHSEDYPRQRRRGRFDDDE